MSVTGAGGRQKPGGRLVLVIFINHEVFTEDTTFVYFMPTEHVDGEVGLERNRH